MKSGDSRRLLPSGIVRGTLSVIGNGVVLDPWAFKAEVEKLAGQGVSVTAMQLATAYGAIANGGERVTPTLVRARVEPDGDQVPIARQ